MRTAPSIKLGYVSTALITAAANTLHRMTVHIPPIGEEAVNFCENIVADLSFESLQLSCPYL
jgi:hypothetical protein